MDIKLNFRPTIPELLFLFLTLTGFSQTDSLTCSKNNSSNLRISFNSSLIYPGIRLGFEIPVNSLELTKRTGTQRERTIVKDRYISANSGWYYHPGFHDNIYFTSEWTMRRTSENGFFTEFSFGPGYSRTFLSGATYKVDNTGNVGIIKSAGYNYILIIAGYGIGLDFTRRKGIPVSAFLKFDNLIMFPYNSTLYFRPVIELGMIYKTEKFIRVFVKRRIIKK